MRDHNMLHASVIRLPYHCQNLVRIVVTRFEYKIVLSDNRDHLLYLGQQLAVPRYGYERTCASLLTFHLRTRVEAGHPHHATVTTGDVCHVLDCRGVDATHGTIQVDSAKHLNPGHHFPHK